MKTQGDFSRALILSSAMAIPFQPMLVTVLRAFLMEVCYPSFWTPMWPLSFRQLLKNYRLYWCIHLSFISTSSYWLCWYAGFDLNLHEDVWQLSCWRSWTGLLVLLLHWLRSLFACSLAGKICLWSLGGTTPAKGLYLAHRINCDRWCIICSWWHLPQHTLHSCSLACCSCSGSCNLEHTSRVESGHLQLPQSVPLVLSKF